MEILDEDLYKTLLHYSKKHKNTDLVRYHIIQLEEIKYLEDNGFIRGNKLTPKGKNEIAEHEYSEANKNQKSLFTRKEYNLARFGVISTFILSFIAVLLTILELILQYLI